MSKKKDDDSCYECKVSIGQGGVSERGNIIELPGGWILNHYGLEEGFLGYLALQTRKHRKDFAELLTNEAVALGGNIKDIQMALRDYWSESFPKDPLERIYVVYFSEYSSHLHFHIIPRPKSVRRKINLCSKVWSRGSVVENRNWKCEAWMIHLASKCKGFPQRYITQNGKNRKEVLKLMDHLRERLSVN